MVTTSNYHTESRSLRLKYLSILSVGFLIFAAIGCAQQPSGYKSISAAEFAAMLSKDSGVVVDVRTPAEYKNGHVSQSVSIDILQTDFEESIKRLDKEKTYYVYCRSGNRSSKASSLMVNLGFKNVYNVKDGIDNILRSGVPVSKE